MKMHNRVPVYRNGSVGRPGQIDAAHDAVIAV
jgi:hypothetical protein